MSTITETTIDADPKVPIIRITREFAGTPEQLLRAHTDPKLFAQWVGPSSLQTRIEEAYRNLIFLESAFKLLSTRDSTIEVDNSTSYCRS